MQHVYLSQLIALTNSLNEFFAKSDNFEHVASHTHHRRRPHRFVILTRVFRFVIIVIALRLYHVSLIKQLPGTRLFR